MKTTKIYSLLALGAMAALPSALQAQEVYESEAVSVTEYTCDNTTYYNSNWRNNWFIQLGAGVNQPFVERGVGQVSSDKAVDRKKMTAVYNFGFGHWFSPYLAVRINALGGALHWDNPVDYAGVIMPGWSKSKHVNLNVEIMWDMLNSICGPNANRVFSIIPYAGIGGDFNWDIRKSGGAPASGSNILEDNDQYLKGNSWTLPVTAGIQFRIRLCKAVDFFAEARASFYGDNWNNCAYGDPIDADVACIGGLSFNINGREFGSYNQCYYMSQIADLNNQVNDLRATVLNDQVAIAALEAQLPCPEAQTVVNQAAPMLTNVRFTINSDVITPEEEVNVYNVAEWMKSNPNENIVVCGYADKDTGTAEYNMELSKRRADNVAQQLVDRYGIAKSRITVKYDGSDVQPYPANNDWNRIVIFSQK